MKHVNNNYWLLCYSVKRGTIFKVKKKMNLGSKHFIDSKISPL